MPDNNKFERCRHTVKDELGDSYCACDVSLFCAECISINENCEKCVDFFSYDDMENLSSNGGGLLSE